MKLFGPKVPEEVAGRVPPGNRLVKGWPVLHYGPIPKFDEAEWDLTVDRLDHARQHVDRGLVPDAGRTGRAEARSEMGHHALRPRLHVEPVAAGHDGGRRPGGV